MREIRSRVQVELRERIAELHLGVSLLNVSESLEFLIVDGVEGAFEFSHGHGFSSKFSLECAVFNFALFDLAGLLVDAVSELPEVASHLFFLGDQTVF